MPAYTLIAVTLLSGWNLRSGGKGMNFVAYRQILLIGIPIIGISLLMDLVGPHHFFGTRKEPMTHHDLTILGVDDTKTLQPGTLPFFEQICRQPGMLDR